MKRKINLSLPLLIFLLMFTVLLTGCNVSNNNKTPQGIIQDAYGNQEFKISFSSETLDKPLDDVYYSANKIPTLPTPQKVGYIFEGWFLDSKFLVPYTDDTLYLCMKDITLYPKWAKETFLHNGTYDIEFDAKIVEGTVVKGVDTDRFGGYRDFSKALNKEACYIEKTDDELFLKLEYDCRVTTPYLSSGQVFNVRIDPRMGTDVYVKDKIDSLADPIKTLFIKIDTWDLSSTLYLDVDWTNYEHESLNEANRFSTTTKYTISIDLTKIIGFSQSFADPLVPLEKGYYLAKSYYRTENNVQSMAKTFNPVYSYIYSDGHENYKLIKQNSPYCGLVALQHQLFEPITDNYYDMMLAFTACTTVFDVESRDFEGVVTSDYFPETYNAGYYRKTVTEFHADTGKVYNIIDLDKDLSKEYIALTAVSGYMERKGGMGYIRQLLSVDYKNLIKLAEVDYEPVSGECYEYADEFCFYPGNFEELDQKNLTMPAIQKFGVSLEMPNFFYSAKSKNDSIRNRTMHSSRVEVVPTKQTSGLELSKSRYKIGEFDVTTKVYGYDVRSGNNLYMDRMSPQIFEDKTINNQLRAVREVKTGKSCEVGEKINFQELFNEYVDKNSEFNNVKYQTYKLVNGEVDFNKPLNIHSKEITFKEDMAIEYSLDTKDGLIKTIVELKTKVDPIIKVDDKYNWSDDDKDGHYTKDYVNNVGDNINYPNALYTWGENSGRFVYNFYEDENGTVSIDPSKSAIFAERSGYHKLYLPTALTDSFVIPERNITLMYELNNEYNERMFIYFDYISDPKKSYTITDDYGNEIAHYDVKFDNDGDRQPIYVSYTGETVYDKFSTRHVRTYYHEEGGLTEEYDLLYYDIYSNAGDLLNQNQTDPNEIVNNINNFLKDKTYGMVTLYYYRYGDILEINFPYKITFNGTKDFEAINYDAYFTDTEYNFGKVKLVGSDMTILSTLDVNMKKYVDGVPSTNYWDRNDYVARADEAQCVMYFKAPGLYRLELQYSIPTNLIGRDNEYRKIITYYQYFEVSSNLCDVEITYVTDEDHKFNDGTEEGSLTKTVKYSLAEEMYFLKKEKDTFIKNNNDRDRDLLNKWTKTGDVRDDGFKPGNFITGKDFINTYNSKHITLYAIWEIRFPVTCKILGEEEKVLAIMDSFRDDYVVEFPTIRDAIIPPNTVFAGWTGGFLGNNIIKDSSYHLPYGKDYLDPKYKDYLTVEAVFKKEFQVKFDVDTNIADLIKGVTVIDGERIDNPGSKLPNIKDKSYRFVGFFVDGKEINLNTYVVTKNVTIEVRFEKK